MGDPKFLRRTYDTPKHPWEAARMDEERKLVAKYGLKNKRELWKAQSILRGFRRQARELQARVRSGEPQAKREADGLLGRLTRLGVLPSGSSSLDDVLALTPEVVLERRFEWIAFRRELAPTPKGARQLIVHGHLTMGNHKVTRPGYLVLAAQEADIGPWHRRRLARGAIGGVGCAGRVGVADARARARGGGLGHAQVGGAPREDRRPEHGQCFPAPEWPASHPGCLLPCARRPLATILGTTGELFQPL